MTQPSTNPQPSDQAKREPPTGAARRGAISERARLGGVEKQKRSPRALAVSALAHLVLAVGIAQLLTFGHGLSSFLDFGNNTDKQERLTYVATRPPPSPPPASGPTAVRRPPVLPLRAPGAAGGVNTQAPAPTPVAAPAPTGSIRSDGTGNGVGEIDPDLKGVRPAYVDRRVWQGPAGNGVAPGRDGTERLDSIIGFAISAARDSVDSLARAQGRYSRAPGDWTKTDKDGNKWGWDNAGIRLGKVVIPNALLSLLPLNAQAGMSGNFTSIERERRLSLSRADILRISDRTLGDADFRKLATELRDRRERERRDRLRAPSASIAPAAPLIQPPKPFKL